MGAEPLADTIVEEREELMVSPFGGDPTLRNGHFLKPTLTSVESIPSLSPPTKPIRDIGKSQLKVRFRGRRNPQKGWLTWVNRLLPKYHDIWKKSGIFGAILASTYHTISDNDLVIALAERWCVETNTFIFPWAEATLTLEDMMVLGGYSVLGDPVFSPLKTPELKTIEEKLSKAHKKLRVSKATATHYAWMDHFVEECGGELEHEAFLALWLSRFVFTKSYDTVGRSVFPIAIHLSRGTPLALAPAVLSTIYSDMSLLKKSIIASMKLGNRQGEGNGSPVRLCSPFQLVQLWAWERFPSVRPNAKSIKVGEPRAARWHRLKRLKVENVGVALDSDGDGFQWRPYAVVVNNWSFNKFYGENEEWLLVKSGTDRELESLARCLRASELVGLECSSIEQYLPHRVAMQFGLDQDLPAYVPRCNASPEAAWMNYARSVTDAKIYIPPRLFESDVTHRYFAWRRTPTACASLANENQAVIKASVRQPRSNSCAKLPRASWGFKKHERVLVSPDFLEAGYCAELDEEDKLTIAELLRNNKRQNCGDQDANVTQGNRALARIYNNGGGMSIYCMLEATELNLASRIDKLERRVAQLKKAKFGEED